MGCCMSSNKKPQEHQNHKHFQEPQNNNRAPPPTLEEETVKEVLSETPISKPQTPTFTLQDDQNQIQPNTVQNKPNNTQMPKLQEHPKEPSFLKQEYNTPEVSHASEVHSSVSVSESFSVSTVQEDKQHREDEVNSSNTNANLFKRANRSPARVQRKRPLSGELVPVRERLAKSPARRAEPSPEKRRSNSRPMRQSVTGHQQQRNAGSSSRGMVRRDVPGRRSRSPAMRGGSRKVQANEVDGKAGIVEDASVESCEKKDGMKVKDENVLQQQGQQEGNESIENPHVSLECFIFL